MISFLFVNKNIIIDRGNLGQFLKPYTGWTVNAL